MTGKGPKHPVEDNYLIRLNQWLKEIEESEREKVRTRIATAITRELPEYTDWLVKRAGKEE